MRNASTVLAWLISSCAMISAAPVSAADFAWEVENPFRFFKNSTSFDQQKQAYDAVRGNVQQPLPLDIIWRTERRLNDPDCKDASTPDSCAATARARYQQSKLGWAAQTIGSTCYDSGKRRFMTQCDRKYSWGTAKEDYVLPDAHTVNIRLAPERLAEAGIASGACAWTWRSRRPGGKAETKSLPCSGKLNIARVPYSLTRASSGVTVAVKLPDGRELTEDVMVDDVLVVAMGDSFASGESNPDRPVTFSEAREMVYDPAMVRQDVASRKINTPTGFGLASTPKFDPRTLPRRKLADEEAGQSFRLGSAEFQKAFDDRAAKWVSPDCHRSQYGYPFRVGIQLALENPHRSITLVSLACTGAEVGEGLFLEKDARPTTEPGVPTKVRPQLDQLSDLICQGGAKGRTRQASYQLPLYRTGNTQVENRLVSALWCPPENRKRPIDLMLLSIGGNDVGFGALLTYSITESASDLAPVAGLIGGSIRFSPDVSRVYLESLDERMKALREALQDGFGVEPSRVLQSSYEPIQFDETGAVCGADPTLGLDVHPKLKLGKVRLQETADFLKDFLARLQCIADAKSRADCPRLATGLGTGFQLVTDHQPAFAKRGICARDPKNAVADGAMMAMPRRWIGADEFTPYSPAAYLPYAKRWRLFRTPNDAFLTAHTHAPNIPAFEILQPTYAGLYSGAIHPTAEGHAIVADHMVRHVRTLLDKRAVADAATR
ncbi:MAG: hypothetical protein JWN71_2235 [Xanthobacteraceae bacterium]|nr:hypothetical protein [Xanthobacteraceae bacterium]